MVDKTFNVSTKKDLKNVLSKQKVISKDYITIINIDGFLNINNIDTRINNTYIRGKEEECAIFNNISITGEQIKFKNIHFKMENDDKYSVSKHNEIKDSIRVTFEDCLISDLLVDNCNNINIFQSSLYSAIFEKTENLNITNSTFSRKRRSITEYIHIFECKRININNSYIIGSKRNQPQAIDITLSHDVYLNNVVIKNNSLAFETNRSKNVNVRNTEIINCDRGLILNNSKNIVLEKVKLKEIEETCIKNNESEVDLSKSPNLTITLM